MRYSDSGTLRCCLRSPKCAQVGAGDSPRRKIALSSVGIGPTGRGGFGLTVALDLHAPHLSRADAEDLMRRAHQRCPYSNATRGNVDVALSVDGTELDRRAA